MAEEIPEQMYGNTIRYLIVVSLILVFATLSLASYSTEGYSLTKYPGVEGEAVVCVEGEVDPTNQTVTVINMDEEPTVNPRVYVNGDLHYFNLSVEDVGVRKRTNSLRLGCNNISYEADSDTKFKVRVEYMSHWRPRIRQLEIGNLKVGHSVRYFIDAEGDREIEKSRLNITDITRDLVAPIFDREFNGSAVRFRMTEPGNYRAVMQVYDGYVWSDVYEAGFTSHVIVTNEQKKASLSRRLEDARMLEHPGFIPAEIMPDDRQSVKTFKRGVNGAYILVERIVDLIKAHLPL